MMEKQDSSAPLLNMDVVFVASLRSAKSDGDFVVKPAEQECMLFNDGVVAELAGSVVEPIQFFPDSQVSRGHGKCQAIWSWNHDWIIYLRTRFKQKYRHVFLYV